MREVLSSTASQSDRNAVRLLQFDFVRATEMAALNCLSWIGKGDKESADAAACDAIRGMFDVMDIRGEIIIGEGIKDEAPGLFAGERLGRWRPGTPRVDIAIDPLDGTTNFSKGLPNAISCIAVAVREDENTPALQFVPAFYMKKLAYPPVVRKAWIKDPGLPLDINAPMKEVIALTARLLEKNVRDVVVIVLDRPRNATIIDEVRSAGASLRMIVDGDISAALGPAMPNSGVDLYAGIGGAPEGILAAAGLRCMGGGMQAQMWPRDENELASLAECGWGDRVEKVYRSRDLVHGDDVLFVATGLNDSPLLRGVQVRGSTVITRSVLMRQRSGTVRFMNTEHELTRRPLRLRSKCIANDGQSNGARTASELRTSSPGPSKSKISCILLFGAPGSGKGTIGKALGTLPGFTHCSSGDIIRTAASLDTSSSERWNAIANGGLISDADLWDLFDEYLTLYSKQANDASGPMLIIDGIPRCHSQVIELSKRVTVRGVLHLDCGDPDTILRRLTVRFREAARPDDAAEQIIHDRLRLYREQTLPLLELYREEIICRIDADQRPDKVLTDTLNQIQQVRSWQDQFQLVAAH